jgi:hypothetical protein
LATKREVESRLRELIQRLEQAEGDVHTSLAGSLPERKTIEISLPDLEASYWTTMAAGKMDTLHRGVPPHTDIRMVVDSDHLMELLDGKRSLFSSFVSGSVKIQASLSDLIRLRKMA